MMHAPRSIARPIARPIAVALALAIGLGLAAGPLARAQPAAPASDGPASAAQAAALYDEGKRHFDIGEYAQAIASWKRSYLLSSAPLLLFNIAQAYRLSNNCAQANRFYLNYRRVEKHPKNQAELDKAMARCAGIAPATGDAASEPPAAPASGGSAAAPAAAPASATSPAAAGPTEPSSTALPDTGASRSPATAASPGSPAASAPAQPPPGGRGWRIAGLVTGAAGIAALGASGLYALAARRDSDALSGSRIGTPYTGDVASTDRSGRDAAGRAQVLLGVGAALAAAGGAMWYLGHRQAAQVDVAIAPGHAEVALSCAF